MMKRRFFIGISIFSMGIVIALGIGTISNILTPFKNFLLTVDNQSDDEISSIEIGLIHMDSKELFTDPIKKGETKRFKPTLSLSGEGSIYLKYTDAKGQSTQETVCGYTEYLSGYSTVTITNEGTTIVQQCN
ncbi:hypothetical protein NSQ90_16305 [Paenibacillus sp. FSL H7-0737]|uniref:hypothetical protein n=1 Tax=Paenibacillus sp. FSL H7-0737 TaxID=1536775 RepID=UPI000B06E7AD|nr:hypothetical protein [Paenibacillus sp. FSL H7-0737]